MCKFIISLFTIFIITVSAAQNDTIVPANKEHKVEYARIFLIFPGAVGNNVLAEGNSGILGIGTSGSLPSFHGFYLGGGLEFTSYKVKDKALAANVDLTNITNVYGELFYKIQLVKNVSINPRIAIGSFTMTQKSGRKDYGTQTGTSYTVGFNVDYRLAGWLKGFAGLNYSLLKGNVKTNAEYMSYYNNLHQVNIIVGLKI